MSQLTYCYQLLFPNGKKYVGFSENPKRRYYMHLYTAARGSKLPVYAAIRKYGSPTLSILSSGTEEQMLALEIEKIREWGLRDRRYGYNVSLGGDTSPMKVPEIAAKAYASREKFFAEHGMNSLWRYKLAMAGIGKIVSEETKKWLSERAITRWSDPKFKERTCFSLRKTMNMPDVRQATSRRVASEWANLTPEEYKKRSYKCGNAMRGKEHSITTRRRISFSVTWTLAQKRVAREFKELCKAS